MSLRFDRNTPPKWNARASRIDFSCLDSHTRRPVHCAVSRAALEDSTGESLDGHGCMAMFARHLGRITAVANSIGLAEPQMADGVLLIDSDDLLQHYPVLDEAPVTAHAIGKAHVHGAAAA